MNKSLFKLPLVLGLSLAASSAAMASVITNSYNVIIGEGNAANGVSAAPLPSFTGSLAYSGGAVSSAILSFNLSDDLSSNASALTDIPREFASLLNVSYAGAFIPVGTLPLSVEVDPVLSSANSAQPFQNAGFETPHTQVGANYFNLDVTNLINTAASGSLSFTLGIDAKYLDVTASNNPSVYQALAAATQSNPGIFYAWEDYVLNSATLTTVSAVPVPAAVWLFGTGLMGLVWSRKKQA